MTSPGHIDVSRLAKLLGMVGSVHDGEALNAARAADSMVRAAGVSWHDVLAVPVTPNDSPIGDYLAQSELLTAWEINFLWSLHRQTYRITPRQREVLCRIRTKIEHGARAAA